MSMVQREIWTCGGFKIKTRNVIQEAKHGGASCPDLEKRTCSVMTMLYEIDFLAQGKFRKLAEKSNLRERVGGFCLHAPNIFFYSWASIWIFWIEICIMHDVISCAIFINISTPSSFPQCAEYFLRLSKECKNQFISSRLSSLHF